MEITINFYDKFLKFKFSPIWKVQLQKLNGQKINIILNEKKMNEIHCNRSQIIFFSLLIFAGV